MPNENHAISIDYLIHYVTLMPWSFLDQTVRSGPSLRILFLQPHILPNEINREWNRLSSPTNVWHIYLGGPSFALFGWGGGMSKVYNTIWTHLINGPLTWDKFLMNKGGQSGVSYDWYFQGTPLNLSCSLPSLSLNLSSGGFQCILTKV